MDRITCFISETSAVGGRLPADDHDFWHALDDLGDALAVIGARFCALVEDAACVEFRRSATLLWTSSDTPSGAHYFWILLPDEPAFRSAVIEAAQAGLTAARHALPAVYWDVAGDEIVWDEAASRYRAP